MIKIRTYDEIMRSYVYALKDKLDTREGSLAYIAGSAMAVCVAQLYEELKLIEDNAYGITAVGEYLDRSVAILNMTRREATCAVVKLEGSGLFSVGDRFVGGDKEYVIISAEDGYYLAECTTAGEVGNNYAGEVLPVEDYEGECSMRITEIVAKGEETEDDESLRKRYMERLNCPVCTGNVSYYKAAINSIAGVGGIKVVPVFDGVGTIKVIITDADYSVASESLVGYVKELLDPIETSGQGYGLVPIGHSVTVESVNKVDVDIQIEEQDDPNFDACLIYARALLPSTFKEINKTWAEKEQIVLWDRVIEDCLLSLGAKDVNVISINGQPNRIMLEENEILGGVTINGA